MRIFTPEVYLISGATGIASFTTQQALTIALGSNWLHLYGSEDGAELKESEGSAKTLTGGQKIPTSKTISGKVTVLEVTPANYTALRALRNTECTILFNEVITGAGGKAYQVKSIYPRIKLISTANDVMTIAITFKKVGAPSIVIEEADLTEGA